MTALRVERLIINMDTAMPVKCAWDDCDRRARTAYQVRAHEHGPWSCSEVNAAGGELGRHMIYAFCSEFCRDYWVACTGVNAHMTASMHRGRVYGMSSAGAARRYR